MIAQIPSFNNWWGAEESRADKVYRVRRGAPQNCGLEASREASFSSRLAHGYALLIALCSTKLRRAFAFGI
jgi:hypothetical protein